MKKRAFTLSILSFLSTMNTHSQENAPYVSSRWKNIEETFQKEPFKFETKHPLIEELEATDELKEKLQKDYLNGKVQESEITPELIARIRAEEEAEIRLWDDFLNDHMRKTKFETPAIKNAGKFTKETLPLGIGSALGTGAGFGSLFGLGALGISLPWAVPVGIGVAVGGAIYAGLRIGTPETFEKLPLRIAELIHSDDLNTESVATDYPNLRFRKSDSFD